MVTGIKCKNHQSISLLPSFPFQLSSIFLTLSLSYECIPSPFYSDSRSLTLLILLLISSFLLPQDTGVLPYLYPRKGKEVVGVPGYALEIKETIEDSQTITHSPPHLLPFFLPLFFTVSSQESGAVLLPIYLTCQWVVTAGSAFF